MRISIIASIADNRTIGHKNRIPWEETFPEVIERMDDLSRGHHVIMGRRTHERVFGGTLPDRENLVVSLQNDFEPFEGSKLFRTIDAAVRHAHAQGESELFILGGQTVFFNSLHICDRLYLTYIEKIVKGDAKFPMVDFAKWTLCEGDLSEHEGIQAKLYIFEAKEQKPIEDRRAKRLPRLRQLTETAIERLKDKFATSFIPKEVDKIEDGKIVRINLKGKFGIPRPEKENDIEITSSIETKETDSKKKKHAKIQRSIDFIRDVCQKENEPEEPEAKGQKKRSLGEWDTLYGQESLGKTQIRSLKKTQIRMPIEALGETKVIKSKEIGEAKDSVIRKKELSREEIAMKRKKYLGPIVHTKKPKFAKSYRTLKNDEGDFILKTLTGQSDDDVFTKILTVFVACVGIVFIAMAITLISRYIF